MGPDQGGGPLLWAGPCYPDRWVRTVLVEGVLVEVLRRMVAAVAVIIVAAGGVAGCTKPTVEAPLERFAKEHEVVTRDFGIASDPWAAEDWALAVGAAPTMVMEFEQWSRNRTMDTHFVAARTKGMKSFVVSWEPWKSVAPELGKTAQHADQPDYNGAAIVSGKLDPYIRSFAQSVAKSGLTVYMRFAHEMNGDWYPWSRDPAVYAQAWRHVVDIFRAEKAVNAKWVFSLNPSPYEEAGPWLANANTYWPGAGYVDYLGSTMINFGGIKQKSVAEFAQRLLLMHQTFKKDMIITELNTAAEGRVKWMTDLRTWLITDATWVRGMVLSQAESRGKTQLGDKVGDLSWEVTSDEDTKPIVRALIEDLT